ncbi:nucleoid associated protein NdpA [Chitinophaga niastensis]|uniref:Nucleoid associated protein NdpA n=1 Tax=Chitinophaga niastensis TaxID=536980 RepID=A0A2P8HSF9_CHINA|nr:nucleoid-associated protein [Chitinophaga niastensis]PSL49170.1 nucleoid associated protein NdpA [Chitinophaga niastensis]
MIHVSEFKDLAHLTIHKVGNSSNEESLLCSKAPLQLEDETISQLLITYFIQPFTNAAEYFRFSHDADLQLNEIFQYCRRIFTDQNEFQEQSVNIAKHLYKHSTHPKIKGGELYIAYFRKCQVDGEEVEAIGIFKSENRDTYLKVFLADDNYQVNYEDGININKLDKGCLVFNTEEENGFKVSIVDSISKQTEAVYWKDAFLQVQRREDSYHQTETAVNMCKQFIHNKLPVEYEMDRVDQVDLLNKSAAYFKEKEQFQLDDFAKEVLGHPDAIAFFKEYRNEYQHEHQQNIPDEFEISAQAVKKQQKVFKSILKLDRNFHVYIHGNREMIERGFDEATNMHYYKLLFENES